MEMLELRLRLDVGELLDAAEDIEVLLDRERDGDLSPAFRDLLFTLDEAITEAYRKHARETDAVRADGSLAIAVGSGSGAYDSAAAAISTSAKSSDEQHVPSFVETRRMANDRVRQLVEIVSDSPHAQTWTFFCECGEAGCNALVSLAVDEFDRLAGQGLGHVLADDHTAAGSARTV